MLVIRQISLGLALFLVAIVQPEGPPSIIRTVKPLYTAMEGHTFKLWCEVSGTKDPPANRTLTAWKKMPEGRIITDKFPRFKMRLGKYLRIKNVKPEDQGTYVCIASNPHGKITREIKLVVLESNTTIRTPPVTRGINLGSPTALCITAREPDALRTTNLPASKDGRPPKFRNPSNRSSEYSQGSPIRLKCHANGRLPLNVIWLKNGRKLSKADRKRLIFKGRVLNFYKLSPSDAGLYMCKVTNAFGSITKTFDIKVTVRAPPVLGPLYKPRILENGLENETARPGDDATFVCSAISRGYPKFHFLKWKSPENSSNSSDPFISVDLRKPKFRELREVAKPLLGGRRVYTHRLVIRNVTVADEAKYTCMVGNSAGWVWRHAFLTVDDEDYVNDEPEPISTSKHSTTTKEPDMLESPPAKDIPVEEIPLAALICVPFAVVILLMTAIVWCYFITKKHHSRGRSKHNNAFQHQEKYGLTAKLYARRGDQTSHVSSKSYVDGPIDSIQSPPNESISQEYEKCAVQLEREPPLHGWIIEKDLPRLCSNRTYNCKHHETDEIRFGESNRSIVRYSGV